MGPRLRSTSRRSWRTSTGTRSTDAWWARSAHGSRRSGGRSGMKWVTRQKVRVNRTATAWLIRRFIDPAATFLFVYPEHVSEVQRREGATGFDAPGATYPHIDDMGRCSFEALVDEYRSGDAALRALAQIVHGADFADQIGLTPESAGVRRSPKVSHWSLAMTTRPSRRRRSSTMRSTRCSPSGKATDGRSVEATDGSVAATPCSTP